MQGAAQRATRHTEFGRRGVSEHATPQIVRAVACITVFGSRAAFRAVYGSSYDLLDAADTQASRSE